LFLLANAIARLCYQEYQLRQRINELTVVYNLTMLLSEARDLPMVLQRTVEIVSEVMGTKAASIRLIDQEQDELVIKAVHNLSPEYLAKGPVRLSKADIDKVALGEQGYEFVADMGTDSRVQYPEESKREGICSMLSAGMRYKGQAVGVLRVYTAEKQTFSPLQIDLFKSRRRAGCGGDREHPPDDRIDRSRSAREAGRDGRRGAAADDPAADARHARPGRLGRLRPRLHARRRLLRLHRAARRQPRHGHR
jgi:hypothetical protein